MHLHAAPIQEPVFRPSDWHQRTHWLVFSGQPCTRGLAITVRGLTSAVRGVSSAVRGVSSAIRGLSSTVVRDLTSAKTQSYEFIIKKLTLTTVLTWSCAKTFRYSCTSPIPWKDSNSECDDIDFWFEFTTNTNKVTQTLLVTKNICVPVSTYCIEKLHNNYRSIAL